MAEVKVMFGGSYCDRTLLEQISELLLRLSQTSSYPCTHSAYLTFQRVIRSFAQRCHSHTVAQQRITRQPEQSLPQFFDVLWLHQKSIDSFAHNAVQAAYMRGNYRKPFSECFRDHFRSALAQRRHG